VDLEASPSLSVPGPRPFLNEFSSRQDHEGSEYAPLSEEDLKQTEHIEDQGEKAFVILRRIIEGSRKEFHLPARPVSENKHLDALADIISFCPIVVKRLTQRTVSSMIDLIYAATGYSLPRKIYGTW